MTCQAARNATDVVLNLFATKDSQIAALARKCDSWERIAKDKTMRTKQLHAELAELRQQLAASVGQEQAWVWQKNGNNLGSMGDAMLVLITAFQLRELIREGQIDLSKYRSILNYAAFEMERTKNPNTAAQLRELLALIPIESDGTSEEVGEMVDRITKESLNHPDGTEATEPFAPLAGMVEITEGDWVFQDQAVARWHNGSWTVMSKDYFKTMSALDDGARYFHVTGKGWPAPPAPDPEAIQPKTHDILGQVRCKQSDVIYHVLSIDPDGDVMQCIAAEGYHVTTFCNRHVELLGVAAPQLAELF